jgi:hypothetical protein
VSRSNSSGGSLGGGACRAGFGAFFFTGLVAFLAGAFFAGAFFFAGFEGAFFFADFFCGALGFAGVFLAVFFFFAAIGSAAYQHSM